MIHQHIDLNALAEQHEPFVSGQLLSLIVGHAAAGRHNPDLLVLAVICMLAAVLDETGSTDARVTTAAILAMCDKGPALGQQETVQ